MTSITHHNLEQDTWRTKSQKVAAWLFYAACALTFISNQYQSIAIGLALVIHISTTSPKKILQSIKLEKSVISFFVIFYLLYVVSVMYQFNESSLNVLETKLPFLIFPLLLPSLKGSLNLKYLFGFAVIGIIIMFAIHFVTFYFLNDHTISEGNHPYVNKLHPSYISIIACCLLHIENIYLTSQKYSKTLLIHVPIYLIIVAVIILSESKVGYVTFVLITLLDAVYLLIKRKNWKISLFVTLALGVTLVTAFYQTTIFTRFEDAYNEVFNPHPDPNYVMSTGERLIAWDASIAIIKANTWLGVGPGNEKNALYEYYTSHNNIKNAALKLDSHQQFLQSSISGGIIIGLALSALFIMLIILSVSNRNIMLFGITLIYLTFGLTESMLERQSGIIPFVFLVFILINIYKDNSKLPTFTGVN